MIRRKIVFMALLMISAMISVSCSDDDDANINTDTDTLPPETFDNVFGLVINEINENQRENFWTTRTAFVNDLLQQPGVLNDNGYQAFFAVDPAYNPDDVVVGLTEYDSEEVVAETFAFLQESTSFANYSQTFEGLSTVVLKPLDGEAFDPATLAVEGQAVEFAIRSANADNSFGELRDAFFSTLPQYEGFLFDREFEVYDVQDDGSLVRRENFQAVAIVWDSPASFSAAVNLIFPTPEFTEFSASITTEFYFATSPANSNTITEPEEFDNVFGLVINEINDGQNDEFWNTRTAFVDELLEQPGVLRDDAFAAFLDFDPNINEQNVVVGLTEYDNEASVASTFGFIGGSQSFAAYDQTFEGLNTVVLKTLDGEVFDQSTIAISGQAVEFAIREANNEDSFGTLRDAFFNLLPEYDGYLFNREFEVYAVQQDGSLVRRENTQAVIIVWESQADFQAALGPLTQTTEFANFSQSITLENYFATTPR